MTIWQTNRYRRTLSTCYYCAAKRVTVAAAEKRGCTPTNGFPRGESPVAVGVAVDAFVRSVAVFSCAARCVSCAASGGSTFTNISGSIMETWQSAGWLACLLQMGIRLCSARITRMITRIVVKTLRVKGGALISLFFSLSRFGTI